MRFEGVIKIWHKDRRFGYIDPVLGGQEIFVHVNSFSPRTIEPYDGQKVSFEVELGPNGLKRAKNVEHVKQRRIISVEHKAIHSNTPQSKNRLVVLPVFLVLYAVVSLLWKPPPLLAAIYIAVSLITFVAYALDKSAAERGAWRTPESTLHLLSLAGGWLGALLAQHYLRHKSVKQQFRQVFWATIILNVTGFVAFCSPFGRQFWVA
jgi:uncharacterized membrane protein YsdA (DUF1294 family)/cold shock CspA family protein